MNSQIRHTQGHNLSYWRNQKTPLTDHSIGKACFDAKVYLQQWREKPSNAATHAHMAKT